MSDQYTASKKLLSLAGVKVRQHLFTRPVTITLSNDQYHPLVEEHPLHGDIAINQSSNGMSSEQRAETAIEMDERGGGGDRKALKFDDI